MNIPFDKLQHEKNELKKKIEFREAVERLLDNPDFKTVIVDGFQLYDCARYAQMSGQPDLKDSARADSLAKAQAAGHLDDYLHTKILLGNQAEKSLNDLIAMEDQTDDFDEEL